MSDTEYLAYQLHKRSPVASLLRRWYISSVKKNITGRTIDFGCGVGELLNLLPSGSLGLEVNQAAVNYCLSKNQNVKVYDAANDRYQLSICRPGVFQTFCMVHVLEHMDDPAAAFRALMAACGRLGIQRIVLVVPTAKGFTADPTHRTHIDRQFLLRHGLLTNNHFSLCRIRYFPLNWAWVGRFFRYHEMHVIFDRSP